MLIPYIEATTATSKRLKIIIMNDQNKQEIPFLFYVKSGICKSNADMPPSGESFKGWLSSANVIRKSNNHSKENVSASIKALKIFLSELKDNQVIKERDLLKYI